jgi:hypothetical protein
MLQDSRITNSAERGMALDDRRMPHLRFYRIFGLLMEK